MKIRDILYIGIALLLTGCSNEEKAVGTPGGEERTPLRLEATLSNSRALTRANGMDFETGDQLLAYIRHTTDGELGSYSVTAADQAPMLVTFTKGSAAMVAVAEHVKGTDDLSTTVPLYWDDFSDSRNAGTDLRTTGHGLQSYYGYCYNGGTPTTALVPAAGTLGWTVPTDQSSVDPTNHTVLQHADLLWSAEQATVAYTHADANTGAHDTLTIPYTHAMSQITVTVYASEGFEGTNPLTSTVLQLNGMNTVTTLTAPTQAFVSSEPETVTMFAESYSTGYYRDFTAIVAPDTKLKEGVKLLDIKHVDDNDYTLTITSNMLTNAQWGADHDRHDDDGHYILTKPGYNYHLTVTVKKSTIQTHATLADWRSVNAIGEGDIAFNDDASEPVMDDEQISDYTGMSVVAIDQNQFTNGASFSLFYLKSEVANAAPDARTNDSYTFATISTFSNADEAVNDKWVNSPEIYWPNGSDSYYFRALAQFNSSSVVSEITVNNISAVGALDPLNKGVNVTQGYAAAGCDILWGTTAKHKGTATGTTYNRGQAIPPRTGDVPIAFEHAMSKVTFILETETAPEAARVNLTGATIAVSNLITSGTINIENGIITYTDANMVAAAIPATAAPINQLLVIPQTIGENAKVTVTLADGTTYSLKLKDCVLTGTTTSIGVWEKGKHYTYTIHLEKDEISFRALIKPWVVTEGSGKANLEWD